MNQPTEGAIIAEAWFTLGGWALAAVGAAWHWRGKLLDFGDWLLDAAEVHLASRNDDGDDPFGDGDGDDPFGPGRLYIVPEAHG